MAILQFLRSSERTNFPRFARLALSVMMPARALGAQTAKPHFSSQS